MNNKDHLVGQLTRWVGNTEDKLDRKEAAARTACKTESSGEITFRYVSNKHFLHLVCWLAAKRLLPELLAKLNLQVNCC